MSVSQARAQGCLEYSSDADTASVANSDSLFITGDSDEQSRSSRSRSASPQTSKVTNGKTPQLNAVSTPFTPKTIAYEALPAPNPFATATTFGKPSSTLFSIQASSDSPSTYNTSAQSTTQAKPNPFASNHPPQFNFHTTADPNTAQKTTDNPNLPISKEPSNPISFTSPLTTNQQENRNVSTFFPFTAPLNRNLSSVGKPSTSSLDIKPSSSARTNFGQPSASPANTANNQAKSVFDEPPSSTPTFSFGTSPLFQLDKPKENDQNDQRTPSNPSQSLHFKFPDTSSSQSEDVAIKTPLFTTPSMPEAKPPSLFPPPAPPISSTSPFFTNKVTPPSNPELPEPSASSQFSSLLTAPHINTALSHQLIGRLSPQPSLSFPIANVPSPVQEQNRAQELTALHTPALPHPPLTKYSPFQYPQQQQASGTLPLNQRSTALDQLSRDLLLGDNGILQHFIQYTVGPIITSSLAQLEDESSREKASQYTLGAFMFDANTHLN